MTFLIKPSKPIFIFLLCFVCSFYTKEPLDTFISKEMRHLSHKKNKTNKCKITFSKLFADNPAKKPKSASMKKKRGGKENKRKRTGSKYKKKIKITSNKRKKTKYIHSVIRLYCEALASSSHLSMYWKPRC